MFLRINARCHKLTMKLFGNEKEDNNNKRDFDKSKVLRIIISINSRHEYAPVNVGCFGGFRDDDTHSGGSVCGHGRG